MEINELKARLKSGEISGWYLFAGEEDYLKKYYLSSLRAAAITDEVFATFNHSVYDGADIDFASVAEDIKSPPMMGDYKLIEWKFADLDSLKEGERAALESLFEIKDEYPYAIFAIMATQDGFDVGTKKRPSKLASRLAKGFDVVVFDKSTDSQLLAWLKKHFDAEGIAVTAQTLNALIFRSGHSMEILNNEVSKLAAYIKANGRRELTLQDVESIASPSSECDAFELSNAIIEKNVDKAFFALSDLKQRRVEPFSILAMLERTYADLTSVALLLAEGKGAADIEGIMKFHPYKTKLYISAAKRLGAERIAESLSELCRLDAASKSGGVSGYGAIEMFITKNL